jgi:hypothetical protein
MKMLFCHARLLIIAQQARSFEVNAMEKALQNATCVITPSILNFVLMLSWNIAGNLLVA